MRIKNSLGLLTLILTSCFDNQNKQAVDSTNENNTAADTIIGSKTITNEIAGSAYRKRAIGYFVIIEKDTSDFTCIFTESKDSGAVGIDLNISNSKAPMTYRQRLEELKLILPKASTEFNFDVMQSINLGRLIESGDLAIVISNQYQQKFGTSNKIESYSLVKQFLKESKLGTDLNDLFKPYSISVESVYPEKIIYTASKDLYSNNKLETDSIDVPNKIFDCMLWAKLIKK